MVHFGHKVINISQPTPNRVRATVQKKLPSGKHEEMEAEADMLVAADGSMSQTRAKFRPHESRR